MSPNYHEQEHLLQATEAVLLLQPSPHWKPMRTRRRLSNKCAESVLVGGGGDISARHASTDGEEEEKSRESEKGIGGRIF